MEDKGRRSTPRVDVVLQLQFRSAGHLLVNYCTNLSRGGLFVASHEPLPVGTQIQLELTVPGDSTTTLLDGEVRWVRQFDADEGPAGMGVKFRDVDSALGRRIDLLVSDFEPLLVFVIGRHESLRSAIASQVRMLVRCETFEYDSPVGLLEEMGHADLVVADGNPVPDETLAFLRALETLERPPPRVVLCDSKAEERRRRFAALSRLVETPVDPAVLRVVVLDTLSHVYAQRRS